MKISEQSLYCIKKVKNTATDSRDVGIGALAYLLAPEMTASLAANFAPT
jgi:hypothetical protein